MWLSHAALAMLWLFTTANWNAWSYPLVEVRCQRAGTRTLNISLGDGAIGQLRDELAPELMCLLNSCTSRWRELEIRPKDVRLKHEGVAEAVGRLLQGSTPLLHQLTLSAQQGENVSMLFIMLDCPPPLNVSLSGVWALFETSTSVTDLTLQLSRMDRLSHVVDVLSSCPLIQRLNLDLEYYSKGLVDFTRTTQTMLPSLVHLELHNIRGDFVADIGEILRCCNIPNLNSITVAPDNSPNTNLIPLLVKCCSYVFFSLPQPFILQEQTIPNVRSISVLDYRPRTWSQSIDQLECLGMQPMIFTHLTELHLVYKNPSLSLSKPHSRIGKVIQDIVCFRDGSITHLTTPPFGDNIMELLKGGVPHLKVCH